MEECGAQKLQLGCGDNLLNGWLNTDVAPVTDAYFLDAAQPFPFRDEAMDVVFAEHLIEELALDVIFKMFKEVHRVLKLGGVIRLAFYSPENLVQMRNGKTNADFCNAYKEVPFRDSSFRRRNEANRRRNGLLESLCMYFLQQWRSYCKYSAQCCQ